MGLSLIDAPEQEPLTLDEVKQHLKQDLDEDDVLITTLISAARDATENYLSRSLITQTRRQTFSCWRLKLERPPHQSIESVAYVGDDGATLTISSSDYQSDLSGDGPAIIVPGYGKSWPTVRPETLNPITVEFVAGYGDNGADVPAAIRQAMLLIIAHLYVNREAVNVGNIINEFPLSARFLLDPYRVMYA